jgi:hypothetical protein
MLCHVSEDSSQYLVKPNLSFSLGIVELNEIEH